MKKWASMSESERDALIEEAMQKGVRDGVLRDTGKTKVGENGEPLKVYESLIYRGTEQ